MEKVILNIHGKKRDILVIDAKKCPNYECFHPHDCPVHAARGVNTTKERYMCLTNVLNGCPEHPKDKTK